MKISPFIRALRHHNARRNGQGAIEHLLVHTGQHYDDRMSRAFFEDLGIPEADINLGVGSGSHAEQVGRTMIEFEKVLRAERPDWVVVVGDVNATCAYSITARRNGCGWRAHRGRAPLAGHVHARGDQSPGDGPPGRSVVHGPPAGKREPLRRRSERRSGSSSWETS